MVIGSELLADMTRRGDRIAVVSKRGQATSYGEMAEVIQLAADDLNAAGVGEGDRVVLEIPPGAELLRWAIGLLAVGAIPAFVEPGHGDAIYARQIDSLEAAGRITSRPVTAARATPGARKWLARRGVAVPPRTRLPRVRRSAGRRGGALPVDSDLDAPAISITTGGTTGQPKHVLHSNASVKQMLERIGSLACDAESVGVDTAPQLLASAALGTTAHVIGGFGARRSRRLERLIFEQAIDAYFGSPATWGPILSGGSEAIPTKFRRIVLGGAPVTPAFLRRLIARVADTTEIAVVYGLTEHGPVTAIDGRMKAVTESDGDLVGEPLTGINLEICAGEVFVDGEPTGDLGNLLDIGGRRMLVLTGRAKNMIIREGVNLYPELLEPLVLDELDDELGVRELALVGVSNDVASDEDIVCWYAPNVDQRLLRRSVERILDVRARPDQYIGRDALPRVGRQQKLDRRTMQVEAST